MKPTANFEWSMPSRAQGWVKAWNKNTALYSQDYVAPKHWDVFLDATHSQGGGSEIVLNHWEITGLDGNSFHMKLDQAPLKIIDPLTKRNLAKGFTQHLPNLGKYRATLTVTNQTGEKSDPVSKIIHLQDLLIVSVGDFMASGEGNPDKDQIIVPGSRNSPEKVIDPVWTDERCHRSQRSGHAQTALALENSQRSVTFLSYACSGASFQHGLIGTYDGMVKPSGMHDPLPSQIKAVANAIGNDRIIDILLITAGLNELGSDGFSTVIETFAEPHPVHISASQDMMKLVTKQLTTMSGRYNQLAWELSNHLHGSVRQVFITEYPADIFQPHGVDITLSSGRSGCGELRLIDDDEGTFIFKKGLEFNKIIRESAEFHGWDFVSGIEKAFDGFGYCNEPTFYVGREELKSRQGNQDGTIHPNQKGQHAIRDRIYQLFVHLSLAIIMINKSPYVSRKFKDLAL